MKKFYVLSLGRSGHHAVMNWICSQIEPSIYFNNCIILKGDPPALGIKEAFKFKNGVSTRYSINSSSDIIEKKKDCNLVLVNIINKKLSDLPITEKTNVIIINRDPYNWIASRFKYGGAIALKTLQYIPIWKDNIKTCLYNYICKSENINLIDINFNNWFFSKEYRKEITKKLGIPFTDKGLNNTEHQGKSKFQVNESIGQNLDILHRWDDFSVECVDDEMHELSSLYFNFRISKIDGVYRIIR